MASRGRGRGRGRGHGNQSPAEQASRVLSWLLRHHAVEEGLRPDEGGWVNVADVFENRKIKPLKLTLEDLRKVVAENDKQRFSLKPITATSITSAVNTVPGDDKATIELANQTQDMILDDTDPRNFLIRANQGHSIKISDEELLKPITVENIPETVVHGTTLAVWPSIFHSGGLKRMKRNHVHFAQGLPSGFEPLEQGAAAPLPEAEERAPVISGMRKSSEVLIYIDIRKAMAAGVAFWISDNGVVLSSGNGDGVIAVEFFSRVEDRRNHEIVMRDGVLLGEPPRGGKGGRGGGGQRGGQRGRGKGKGERGQQEQGSSPVIDAGEP